MQVLQKLEAIEYINSKKEWTRFKIKVFREKRTLSQNKMIHVLFDLMKKEEQKLWNNYTTDQIKYSMKCFIFWTVIINMWWIDIPVPLNETSNLNTLEAKEFIEQQIEFLNNNYNLCIIWPDDQRLLDYYNNYIF